MKRLALLILLIFGAVVAGSFYLPALDSKLVLMFASIIFGVTSDFFWKEPVQKRLRKLLRRFTRPYVPSTSSQHTVLLGSIDTYVCLIDGNAVNEYKLDNLRFKLDEGELPIPPDVAADIEEINRQQTAKESVGESHAWNGEYACVRSFNCGNRTPDSEDMMLSIRFQKAQYYQFMATCLAIYNEFEDFKRSHAAPRALSELPIRNRFLEDFNAWRTAVPPNVVTGLPLNLCVCTEDNPPQLVFSKRSKSVAIGPNRISAAVNENLHPKDDLDRSKGGNFFAPKFFLSRALSQEIGWRDEEHSEAAKPHLLAFLVDIGGTAYGLVGYVELPLSFAELKNLFNERCKDRPETVELIAVPFEREAICQFIHDEGLYDSVGVTALLALVHREHGWGRWLERTLRTIQNESARIPTDGTRRHRVRPVRPAIRRATA